MAKPTLSLRHKIVRALVGKDFIPYLNPLGALGFGSSGRIKTYSTKDEQIQAITGWVFAANSAIVEPAAAVELKLYRKGSDGEREEVTSGQAMEILELLDVPNMVHTGEQLRQLHFTYMNIVGESYIYMRDLNGGDFLPTRGRLPAALDIFPAHQTNFRLGNRYTDSVVQIGGQKYPITSFIRDLNPDPANPYMGRSVIAASAATIDMEDQMKNWNQQLFANNARPSLIFTSNEEMSDESYERWKQQFRDEHTGADQAYKPLLIEGGDAKPYMLNQQDLDFLNSRKFTRDEILAMFKVSPGVLGIVENVNRANLDAGFYIHAVVNTVPRLRQFVRQINASLVKVYDPTLELDFVNPVPEDVEAKLAAATAGVDKWWTKNEVRAMYGAKPLDGDLGEHIVIIAGKSGAMTLDEVVDGSDEEPESPASTPTPEPDASDDDEDPDDNGPDDQGNAKSGGQPRKKASAAPEPTPVAPPEPTDEEKQAAREARVDAKVAAYRAAADGYIDQMVRALHTQFDKQRQTVLANAQVKGIKNYGTRRKITKADKRVYLNDLIDWAMANEDMAGMIAPILLTLIATTGQQAMKDLNLDPSMFNSVSQEVVDEYRNAATRIATDVNAETEKQLRATLGQGIDAGEDFTELTARIEQVFGAALTYRSNRIAQTEVTREQSMGDIFAWKQSGVVNGKEWATAKDERVCPYCRSLDGTIIHLDKPFFEVGDTLTVDNGDPDNPKPQTMNVTYDDVQGPPLHVSCRCTALPVLIPVE